MTGGELIQLCVLCVIRQGETRSSKALLQTDIITSITSQESKVEDNYSPDRLFRQHQHLKKTELPKTVIKLYDNSVQVTAGELKNV